MEDDLTILINEVEILQNAVVITHDIEVDGPVSVYINSWHCELLRVTFKLNVFTESLVNKLSWQAFVGIESLNKIDIWRTDLLDSFHKPGSAPGIIWVLLKYLILLEIALTPKLRLSEQV